MLKWSTPPAGPPSDSREMPRLWDLESLHLLKNTEAAYHVLALPFSSRTLSFLEALGGQAGDYISQPSLQLGMATWLNSSQGDMGQSDDTTSYVAQAWMPVCSPPSGSPSSSSWGATSIMQSNKMEGTWVPG